MEIMKRAAVVHGVNPPPLDVVKYSIEKRLFIGGLPASTTTEEVRQVFGKYGNLQECRLVKGVAFVSYDTWAAAHRALRATDTQPCLQRSKTMPGQGLSVSFAERTMNVGRWGGAAYSKGLDHTRIYIAGLPADLNDTRLVQLASSCGEVLDANLLPPQGNRRACFVQYSLWGEALDAIELFDGKRFPGTTGETMSVDFAFPTGDGIPADVGGGCGGSVFPVAQQRRLVLDTVTCGGENGNDLESLMEIYLNAIDDDTPDNRCSELHKKIMAARAEVAAIAAQGLDPSLNPRRLVVSQFSQKLHDQMILNRLFEPFGHVVNVCLLKQQGVAYIQYHTFSAASRAVANLNGKHFPGVSRDQGLYVNFASGSGSGNDHESLMELYLNAVDDDTPEHICSELHKKIMAARAEEAAIAAHGLDPSLNPRRLVVDQLSPQLHFQMILNQLFEPYGHVVNLRFLKQLGVAYIQYQTFSAASQAVANLNGQHFPGVSRDQGLYVNFAKHR